MTVSLVMPLYNAAHLLDRVLPPVRAALDRGEVAEVLVVDDGSTDGGAEECRRRGLTVLPSGGRLGPGACRNLAAEAARGDVLLFVDSDVVMHDDVPRRIREVLAADPECVAVFGSYDDRPPARGVVTQYKNLLHHFTHHRGRGEASTFWAGCGAVRRAAFAVAGGFDTERYPYPSIEDIELGYRLRRNGGRIRLEPDIQGTHLKRWTLRSMLFTDIFRRAVPWGRLLRASTGEVRDLNVTTREQLKAALAGLVWLGLLACLVEPRLLPVALVLLAAAYRVNADFFRLVWRRNGMWHMLGALFLHQLYYLYSALAYIYCSLEAVARR